MASWREWSKAKLDVAVGDAAGTDADSLPAQPLKNLRPSHLLSEDRQKRSYQVLVCKDNSAGELGFGIVQSVHRGGVAKIKFSTGIQNNNADADDAAPRRRRIQKPFADMIPYEACRWARMVALDVKSVEKGSFQASILSPSFAVEPLSQCLMYEVPNCMLGSITSDGEELVVQIKVQALQAFFRVRAGESMQKVLGLEDVAAFPLPSVDPQLLLLGRSMANGGFSDPDVFRTDEKIRHYLCIMGVRFSKIAGASFDHAR